MKYKISSFIDYKIVKSKERKSNRKKATMISLQKKVDQLLDKVSKDGFDALSEDEKDQLYTYSKRIGRDVRKD
tara:strand:- start:298 stop:516 length:219 start_codon:yes stop_codon:yes gene_type:complete